MIESKLRRLEDVAGEYFGLSPAIAKRKAALCALPVPAFRLTDTGRGPLFVTEEALQGYVDSRIAAADKLHKQMWG